MPVSQTAEYALRAVICLAQDQKRSQTTKQLAESTRVPHSYLPKVLQPLTRVGIVSAQRGSRGGYRLEADPTELSVLDVVQCVDPVCRIEKCPLNRSEHKEQLCALHQLLDDTIALTLENFGRHTIEKILISPHSQQPFCCPAMGHVDETDAGGAPSRTDDAIPKNMS